jgi:CheY-like chemotaxis protein
MHGGTIDVKSAGENQGATFNVRLPIAEVSAQTVAVSFPPELTSISPSLTGLRILVVDDEADARTLARRVLEERGAHVLTAGSAAEALEAMDGGSALSVIVSDIGMPEQDGYDFMKQMRSLPGDAGRIPAVALTHVSKPVDPAELVTVIANLVGRTGVGA